MLQAARGGWNVASLRLERDGGLQLDRVPHFEAVLMTHKCSGRAEELLNFFGTS